jgi:glutathione S-transferase
VALTGGYRRTPILQIGADIYCDTALIADLLEELRPEPSLYPKSVAAASRTLAQWADSTLFWTAIPYTLQPEGAAAMFRGATPEQMRAFAEDRKPFSARVARPRPPEAKAGFRVYLSRLAEMLGEQQFFFGEAPSIADFSIAHCLWFVTRGGPVAAILNEFPSLTAWLSRINAYAARAKEELSSATALEIANASTLAPSRGFHADVHGLAPGTMVSIAAIDYGTEPVIGALYGTTANSISIVREDSRAGRVAVHFPRLGFEMLAAK